jgi:hypothetical protein
MDGWMHGWMDGWMAGWLDGWMDAWMEGGIKFAGPLAQCVSDLGQADKKTSICDSFFFRLWSAFSLHFEHPALRHSPVLGHILLSWVISRAPM